MESYDNIQAVRNSDLGAIKQILHPVQMHDPTQAYAFGNLIDAMLTETHRINFYKKTLDGLKIDSKIFGLADIMRMEFIKNKLYRDLLIGAEFQAIKQDEAELMYNPNVFGSNGIPYKIKRKCKFDLLKPNLGIDLKSMAAITYNQFLSAIHFFDYDRQAAWYMDIAKIDNFAIIGISKKSKKNNSKIFRVSINRDSELYKSGREKYSELAYYASTGILEMN